MNMRRSVVVLAASVSMPWVPTASICSGPAAETQRLQLRCRPAPFLVPHQARIRTIRTPRALIPSDSNPRSGSEHLALDGRLRLQAGAAVGRRLSVRFHPEHACPIWRSVECHDLFGVPTWSAVVIPSTVIGVVKMRRRDGKGPRVQNARIMAVPWHGPRYKDVEGLRGACGGARNVLVMVIEMTHKKVTIAVEIG
jgi:hypothetical protein